MTNAPAKGTNAAGVPRNGVWMMKQAYAAKPEMFSDAARNSVFVENRMPAVDEQWIKFNPTHSEYIGQQLQHHHIDGGKMAVAIPKGLHYDRFSEIHAYLKGKMGGALRGAKFKGMLGGALNFVGTISMFNFKNPDSWINAFSSGAQPEDYIGKVKKDWEDGTYLEIKSVDISYTPVLDANGKAVVKDGVIQQRVSRRVVTGAWYSDYIWDDDSKQYKGVNKIGESKEVWDYDSKGNRKETPVGPVL